MKSSSLRQLRTRFAGNWRKIANFVVQRIKPMNSNPQSGPPRAIVSVAGDNGAYLGLYLILLAVFSGLSQSFGLATFLVWAGSVYLPFFLYRLLKNHYVSSGYRLSALEIWANALLSWLLGALLQAVAVYVLLRWAVPDFVASQMQTAIDTFRSIGTPEGDMWAEKLENLRAVAGIPTASDVASNLIVFNILCGAIVGFVDAVVLKLRCRPDSHKS